MLDKRDSLFLAQTKKEKVIKRIITFDLLIFNINEFKDPLTLTFYFVTWIFFQERNIVEKTSHDEIIYVLFNLDTRHD